MKRRIVALVTVIALSTAAWVAAPARGCLLGTCTITGAIRAANIVPNPDAATLQGIFTGLQSGAGFDNDPIGIPGPVTYDFTGSLSFAGPNATTGSGSGIIYAGSELIHLGFSVRRQVNPLLKNLAWIVMIISGGTGTGTYSPRTGQFIALDVTVGG